ncbi:peptidoglycan-binding protein [Pseudomonas sp. FFUP_PS_473]|uniref:LysM peptidoglycan-binding domain-containing protein n=1 Tax=Pseudomonas sp. FFUP_PS_473 TaxID=2060418 RepID=UPI000C7A1169|nr:LysM domain-containing protein [Pseudomonas sp. FFUP_PS_473]PLP95985.1 peptidoglycan-binding protein [Pseudomonas sp. FFUP_PS_473]
MLVNTYTVKAGDTLVLIAQQNGSSVPEVLALNPIIKDPDVIKVGWQLNLPATPSQIPLPPLSFANDQTCLSIEGSIECKEELVDVVHVTGSPHLCVLTAPQAKALKQEVVFVRELMDELHETLAAAQPVSHCARIEVPYAACSCTRCVKEDWMLKAEAAGVLTREAPVEPAEPSTPTPTTEEDLSGQLHTLQEARDWYQRYEPSLFSGSRSESNWEQLQQQKVQDIDAKITELRTKLAAQRKGEAEASSTRSTAAMPDLKHGKGRERRAEQGHQQRTGIHVVEVILFSDPSRRYYIRTVFHERIDWKVRISTQTLASKPFNKQLAGELIKDIQSAISTSRKSGPLGSLEAKLASWSSDKDNLLNTLHQEVSWTSNATDATRYAVSADAQALRFAASASAGINSWNPAQGLIDVGVKGTAEFSLADAAVSFNSYFPSQGGYLASITYRNGEGKTVRHPLGVFRLSGRLELSCFVGTQLQGEAATKTQYKPREQPAGATALLGTPTLDVGKSGYIGVKGTAFAGAQTGGALTGNFQWIEPNLQGTGNIEPGQANANSNWVDLAQIKAEGNVALGAGGSGEFGIEIAKNRLAIRCSGSLVLGPGAGGGFTTVVDVELVGKLALLFCKALAEVDYRYLLDVTEDAFDYLSAGLFKVATTPVSKAVDAFRVERDEMLFWWSERQGIKAEAYALADHLMQYRAVSLKAQPIPLNLLPPETMGPMVHLLTESYVESFEDTQEKALVMLLSALRSWRQFIEVLEHCDPQARKVNAMESLARINALLDWRQQDEFNNFIDALAVNLGAQKDEKTVAWTPGPHSYKMEVLLAAQRSGRFTGLA